MAYQNWILEKKNNMKPPKCESCNSIVKIIQINSEDNIYICEKCLKGLNTKPIKNKKVNGSTNNKYKFKI